MRKLSKVGAVLVAVFALTAIGASAAQATEATFGWASGTTKIVRSANTAQLFTVTSSKGATVGSFNCNTVTATATVAGTGAASVETNAGSLTYNNSRSADTCPASLGTATITTHNCQYVFKAGLSVSTGHSTGTVDITNCPSTSPIEVSVAGGACLVKISNQTGIGPVTYTTTAGTPSTVTAEVNAHNIVTSSSGLCGTGGVVGDYEGDVTFEGTTSGGVQTAIKVLP